MVWRSARIWQGWNSSVSALTTGTVAWAAISSIRSWPKVRHTIAETMRVSTSVVSATDSPRPSWLEPASITSGLPPSSAMPVAKETRVRVEALSNTSATVRGPSRGRLAQRSPASSRARARTSFCAAGLRSSARRKWRGMSGPLLVGGGGSGPLGGVEQGGQRLDEGAELLVGDDQRRGEPQGAGVRGVEDEAVLEGGDDDLRRDRGGEGDPLQQSRAAHAGDPRIAPGELEDPGLQLRAEGAGLLEQAVLGEGAEHGEGHGRAQGVAAEGGAVLAGAQQAGGVLAEGEHGT